MHEKFFLCMNHLNHFIARVRCEIWAHMKSPAFHWHYLDRASRPDTGRAARQSGMCPCEQNGEIHRTICNQKHCLFCSIEYEIWAPIVVLICCIFMNTIIVNTSTYFNSLLFWMIAQNVKVNVTIVPCLLLARGIQ